MQDKVQLRKKKGGNGGLKKQSFGINDPKVQNPDAKRLHEPAATDSARATPDIAKQEKFENPESSEQKISQSPRLPLSGYVPGELCGLLQRAAVGSLSNSVEELGQKKSEEPKLAGLTALQNVFSGKHVTLNSSLAGGSAMPSLRGSRARERASLKVGIREARLAAKRIAGNSVVSRKREIERTEETEGSRKRLCRNEESLIEAAEIEARQRQILPDNPSKASPPAKADDPESMEIDDTDERRKRTLFVGNVPNDTAKTKLLRALGLTSNDYEKVFYRSFALHPKFQNNRRAGVFNKAYAGTRDSHNAYVVMRSEEMLNRILSLPQPPIIGEHTLQLDGVDKSKKFSKYKRPYTVFVGALQLSASEDDVRTAFSAVGPVDAVRIIRDSSTGFSKGFGFVSFKERKFAQKAIKQMKGVEIKGRVVRVLKALNCGDAEVQKEEREAAVAKSSIKAQAAQNPAKRRISEKKKKKQRIPKQKKPHPQRN